MSTQERLVATSPTNAATQRLERAFFVSSEMLQCPETPKVKAATCKRSKTRSHALLDNGRVKISERGQRARRIVMGDVPQRTKFRHLTRDVGGVSEAVLLKVRQVKLTQKQRVGVCVIVESRFGGKAGAGKTCTILSISSGQRHAQVFLCGECVNGWLGARHATS